MKKSASIMLARIQVLDKKHLKTLIADAIKTSGPNCSLNHLDVSGITNMSALFYHSDFNGDISNWNVSNVIDMDSMFYRSLFNGDISRWSVGNVKDFSGMFQSSSFHGDISRWNTQSATDMSFMFQESPFDGNVTEWDVSKVVDIRRIFDDCQVSHHLTKWRLPALEQAEESFTTFNDSLLGYLDVLRGTYDFPPEHPRAALFHQISAILSEISILRDLTISLDLEYLRAARFIYESMHDPSQCIAVTPESFTGFEMR